MKKAGAALIGCGRIGFLLEDDPLRYKPCTHYGGAKAAGLRIDCACDIDAKRLEEFSRRARIPGDRLFDSYEALLRELRPALVVIATWTESHARIGAFAAGHGARVIVCEKPLSYDLASARSLLLACRRNGTRLIVNHERRFEPRYRAVKGLIDGGGVGEVKSVHASMLCSGHHGPSRIQDGGGPLLHDGTHLVDICRYLFGDIAWVEGDFQRRSRRRGFEDRAVAWMRTRGGVDIFLEAGGERRYFVFELEISGSEGRIVIGNGYQELYLPRSSRLYTGFRDLAPAPFPRTASGNCFSNAYREAKRLLEGEEMSLTSGGEDGYRALEAVHAIYLSSHLGKKRIELPVKPDMIDLNRIFSL